MRHVPHPSVTRTRGFSFAELLFAVMILGIGFILIAAIFPAGLTQSKASFDETHAADVARAAMAQLGAFATNTDFPATDAGPNTPALVMPVQTNSDSDARTQAAHSSMIQASDPRYAWVALYRRQTGENFAQVLVLVVNRSDLFKGSDFVRNTTAQVRGLEPRPVTVNMDTNQVALSAPPPAVAAGENNVNQNGGADGGFVVIASDNLTSSTGTISAQQKDAAGAYQPTSTLPEDWTFVAGKLNGFVIRLGNNVGGTTFESLPGSGLESASFTYYNTSTGKERLVTVTSLQNAIGYIVGRNRVTTSTPTTFDGAALDVAYYTSFIDLR